MAAIAIRATYRQAHAVKRKEKEAVTMFPEHHQNNTILSMRI